MPLLLVLMLTATPAAAEEPAPSALQDAAMAQGVQAGVMLGVGLVSAGIIAANVNDFGGDFFSAFSVSMAFYLPIAAPFALLLTDAAFMNPRFELSWIVWASTLGGWFVGMVVGALALQAPAEAIVCNGSLCPDPIIVAGAFGAGVVSLVAGVGSSLVLSALEAE